MDADRSTRMEGSAVALRVIAQQWVSLDGFAAGPDGEQVLFDAASSEADEASQRWNDRLLDAVDEVLLGRTTYDAFMQFWPTADASIAPRVNTIPKVVCSRTLDEAPWGEFPPARVERDAVAYVRSRRIDRATLLLWGSLDLMHQLHAARQIDELDLFVAPVALGVGTPLIPADGGRALELIDSSDLSGVMHLRYALRR